MTKTVPRKSVTCLIASLATPTKGFLKAGRTESSLPAEDNEMLLVRSLLYPVCNVVIEP